MNEMESLANVLGSHNFSINFAIEYTSASSVDSARCKCMKVKILLLMAALTINFYENQLSKIKGTH